MVIKFDYLVKMSELVSRIVPKESYGISVNIEKYSVRVSFYQKGLRDRQVIDFDDAFVVNEEDSLATKEFLEIASYIDPVVIDL